MHSSRLIKRLMDKDKFRDIVRSNISRYPLAQVEDLYKLSHQAALGSEHAVKDVSTAREWLRRELDEVVEKNSEPLIDPISADGEVVRVHLWPYNELGGRPEYLLQAFVKTANEYKGSVQKLEQYLQIVEHMVEDGKLHQQFDSLRSTVEKMRSAGYPPVHHSSQYVKAYKPSYRVVARQFLPKRFK